EPNQEISGFYQGEKPDNRGRYLREMQQWPDDRLEDIHDFIQWMFPLPERSGVNPRAPVLDPATIAEFRTSPEMQQNLRKSFLRMIGFYGLTLNATGEIERAVNFKSQASNWLSPGNHNHLRITRII